MDLLASVAAMTETEAERQRKLTEAMRNRLKAVAARAGKTPVDAGIAMARIFSAIEECKRARRMGLWPEQFQDDIQDLRNGTGKFAPKFASDFAAAIVRMVKLRKGIGGRVHLEAAALEKSAGVTFDRLSSVEQRAALILMGEKRPTRNPHDAATKIARMAQADWGCPNKYFRATTVRLFLEEIIRIAIPVVEDLSGEQSRGANAAKDAAAIEIEPPALGALVALARMNKKNVSLEYVSKVIAKHHRYVIENK